MTRFIRVLLVLAFAVGCRDGDGADGRAAAPSASASSAAAEDMCREHGVPAALCTKCNPALATVFKKKGDWCPEHGFPESFCPVCHPGAKFPDVGKPSKPATDWCGGHGLPESMCTKCHPELVAKFKASGDWCDEHGYPESACPVCNPREPPEEATTGDWCIEHGLPESKCTKCNTALVATYEAKGDFCEEHGFPESVCPVCNPQKPPPGAEKAAIEQRVVRLVSEKTEAAAGIETVVAKEAEASPAVTCAARIAFDADRVADIRAIVPGIVRRMLVSLGDEVKAGDLLFELESTRVGEVQGALIEARGRLRAAKANLDRQRKLHAEAIVAARQVELAEQELDAATADVQRASATLRLAGAAGKGSSGRYGLTAPISGTLVRRPAVLGVLATDATSLATLADTSVMWGLCDVPEHSAARVAVGQPMQVTIAGIETEPVTGEITWLSAEVDPRTRTVAARAELPNAAGRLRANQFARARIETGAPRRAVAVPRDAVQRVGDLEVVFIREKNGVYQPRVVRRYGGGDTVQIEGRVKSGDLVVTTGAVLLRTEIMPGSIGAGCCEVEPRGDG